MLVCGLFWSWSYSRIASGSRLVLAKKMSVGEAEYVVMQDVHPGRNTDGETGPDDHYENSHIAHQAKVNFQRNKSASCSRQDNQRTESTASNEYVDIRDIVRKKKLSDSRSELTSATAEPPDYTEPNFHQGDKLKKHRTSVGSNVGGIDGMSCPRVANDHAYCTVLRSASTASLDGAVLFNNLGKEDTNSRQFLEDSPTSDHALSAHLDSLRSASKTAEIDCDGPPGRVSGSVYQIRQRERRAFVFVLAAALMISACAGALAGIALKKAFSSEEQDKTAAVSGGWTPEKHVGEFNTFSSFSLHFCT